MEKITFEGKEYKIAFNLATEIEYYRLTGKNISARELVDENGNYNPVVLSDMLKAVINANNPGMSADDILLSPNRGSVDVLVACANAFIDWVHIPEHSEDHVYQPKDAEGEKKA